MIFSRLLFPNDTPGSLCVTETAVSLLQCCTALLVWLLASGLFLHTQDSACKQIGGCLMRAKAVTEADTVSLLGSPAMSPWHAVQPSAVTHTLVLQGLPGHICADTLVCECGTV